MKSPLGIELKVGQMWREIDQRINRPPVEIVELIPPYHVRIKVSRTTTAQLRRFNGKRGGYGPVA